MHMKIFACFLLSILLFSGCVGNLPDSNSANSTVSYSEEELARTTRLESDTNLGGTLTIRYLTHTTEDKYFRHNAAVEVMRQHFPNVEIKIEGIGLNVSQEEYATQLATEIMAGIGPDVFFVQVQKDAVINPVKMMQSGAFLDLTDYFRQDGTYNPSDFNQTVLQSGQWNGKQYLIPVEYKFPLILTTERTAEAVGFQAEKCTDYISTLEQLMPIIKENRLNCSQQNIIYKFTSPFEFPRYTGLSTVDYNSGTVNLQSPQLKETYSILKEMFPYRSPKNDYIGIGTVYSQIVCNQTVTVVDAHTSCYLGLFKNLQLIIQTGETPVVVPLRTMDGSIEAYVDNLIGVSRNTKNPEAAYRFIRCWLSDEYLLNDENWGHDSYPSVNNKAVYQYLEKKKEPLWTYFDTGDVVEMKGIPEEYISQYKEMLNDISSCRVFGPDQDMMMQVMEDYLTGERSYDSCIAELQGQLEIYASE